MTRALLIALVSLGCAKSEVDVTATFDSSIDDTTLGQIVDLFVESSESWRSKIVLTEEVRKTRTGRFVYRAAANSGNLDLAISARDSQENCLAHGARSGIALSSHGAVPAPITLSKGGCGSNPDMGTSGTCAGLLCDDFENGIGSHWGHIDDSLVTIDIDDNQANRGTHSLHVHVAGATDSAFHDAYLTTSPPSDPLYVRTFMFVSAAAGDAQPGFLDARQVSGNFQSIDIGIGAGRTLWVGTTTPSPFTLHSSAMIPTEKWVCLEWKIAFSGAVDTQTFLDASELTDLHGSGPGVSPSFGQLRIGVNFLSTAAAPAFDLWFDDLVLDSKPVGCQ